MAVPVIPTFGTNEVPSSSKLAALTTALAYALNPPRVTASRTGAQSIPNGAVTAISLDSTTFVSATGSGMFTPTSTTISLVDPGGYTIAGGVTFANNATGARMVLLYANGSEIPGGGTFAAGSAGDVQRQSAATGVSGASGDTFLLQVYQTSGGALAVTNSRLTVSRESGA